MSIWNVYLEYLDLSGVAHHLQRPEISRGTLHQHLQCFDGVLCFDPVIAKLVDNIFD